MLELLWFFVKIFLLLMIGYSLLHAFITHLIVYYETRLRNLNSGIEEPFPWGLLFRSFFIEAGCNFVRILLLPFAKINLKAVSTSKTAMPILLIHGYLQNKTDWLWFRRSLHKIPDIGPIYSQNLNQPFDSIANLAESLREKIEQIRKENDNKSIILIGHSMGGLVSSYYNEYLAKEGEIAMVITLATPFQGTRLAAFGYGKNIKEMYPNSPFLADLCKKIQNSQTPYYFIATKFDNVIVPWQSSFPSHHTHSLEDKALNTHSLLLEKYGHLRLLISNEVIEQIKTWVLGKSTTISK